MNLKFLILILTMCISCHRDNIILTWGNIEYKKGDRVVITDSSGLSCFNDEETQHPISVLIEKGKTGTVISGVKRNSKELGVKIDENEPLQVLLIEWDEQEWTPYYLYERSNKKIKLKEFRASIHVEYIEKIKTSH